MWPFAIAICKFFDQKAFEWMTWLSVPRNTVDWLFPLQTTCVYYETSEAHPYCRLAISSADNLGNKKASGVTQTCLRPNHVNPVHISDPIMTTQTCFRPNHAADNLESDPTMSIPRAMQRRITCFEQACSSLSFAKLFGLYELRHCNLKSSALVILN